MHRTILLVSAALFVALAAAPTANADHMGPCWHQYAEAGLAFALDHHSAKQLGSDVGGCIDGTVWWICHGYPWSTCTLS